MIIITVPVALYELWSINIVKTTRFKKATVYFGLYIFNKEISDLSEYRSKIVLFEFAILIRDLDITMLNFIFSNTYTP